MEHSIQFVIKREPDRCEFVPPRLFGSLMAGGFGAGSAFLVYLSAGFFRRSDTAFLGAIFLLVAVYSAGLGIHAWRTRSTPLRIEFGGRITYGERELCAAGTVRAVRIARSRSGEAKLYEVCLEMDGDKVVSIPSQYFASFHTAAQAHPFAAELADALGIRVIE